MNWLLAAEKLVPSSFSPTGFSRKRSETFDIERTRWCLVMEGTERDFDGLMATFVIHPLTVQPSLYISSSFTFSCGRDIVALLRVSS
jgi:hypothetical protein